MKRPRYCAAIPAVYWLAVFSLYVWSMVDHRGEARYAALWFTYLLTLPWSQLGSNFSFQMWSFHHHGELVNIFAWFFFVVICCAGLNAILLYRLLYWLRPLRATLKPAVR
jgi:hypothetical protein